MFCESNGNPSPTISWLNGSIIVSNSSTLLLKQVQLEDSARYVCQARTGHVIRDTFVDLTVNCK